MKIKMILVAAILCSLSMSAFSEKTIRAYDDRGRPNPDAFDWTGIAVGGNVGTLGVGGDVTVYLGPKLNFRASASLLPYDYDDEIEDIEFDLDIDFTTLSFLLDFFPSDTGLFRISAGIVYADNILDISATPTESETIGDNEYTPEQIGTISGDLTFDEWSPYIGIGFGNPVRPDTAFSAAVDIGVLFQTYETTISANGTLSGTPIFEDDLDELKKDVDDELENFKIYPVITVSLSYHF